MVCKSKDLRVKSAPVRICVSSESNSRYKSVQALVETSLPVYNMQLGRRSHLFNVSYTILKRLFLLWAEAVELCVSDL